MKERLKSWLIAIGKEELKRWAVFIVLIIITVPLIGIGFKYVGMSRVWQSILSFLIGMSLMIVSQILVRKFWK